MKVNANQLKYLLSKGASKERAWYMIQKVRLHLNQIKDINAEKKIDSNPSVDVDEFDKFYGLQIRFAMEDIYNNALKRPAFKKYLLHDIPEQELGREFKKVTDTPKKTIRLKPALRSLMNPKDLEKVNEYWQEHFAGKQYTHLLDKVTPNFKP